MLKRLQAKLDGRLAIVSGRAVADLQRHLDCSGIAISGSHGFEMKLAGGVYLPLSVPAGLGRIKEAISAFAAQHPGMLVEKKPAGAALHYRQAPDKAAEVTAFMAGLAAGSGFSLQHGKMVVELRATHADKGRALRAFMAEPEFAAARPVFVGDDLTDEDAFEVAKELGGGGILVGAPRPSAAQWRLPDVAAVSQWLSAAAARP